MGTLFVAESTAHTRTMPAQQQDPVGQALENYCKLLELPVMCVEAAACPAPLGQSPVKGYQTSTRIQRSFEAIHTSARNASFTLSAWVLST